MHRKDCNLQPVCEICNKSVLHLKYKHGNRFPRTCSSECKGKLISMVIQPGLEARSLKATETRKSILPSGETIAQAAARKAAATMQRDGTRLQAAEKRLKTMRFDQTFAERVRSGMMKVGPDGLTAAERGAKAARETMIRRGLFVDPASKDAWYRYSRRVRYLTSKQPLHLLEGFEKRGPVESGGWHLDHIVSIRSGFDRGLKPEEVAALSNLRMIPAIENIKKGPR